MFVGEFDEEASAADAEEGVEFTEEPDGEEFVDAAVVAVLSEKEAENELEAGSGEVLGVEVEFDGVAVAVLPAPFVFGFEFFEAFEAVGVVGEDAVGAGGGKDAEGVAHEVDVVFGQAAFAGQDAHAVDFAEGGMGLANGCVWIFDETSEDFAEGVIDKDLIPVDHHLGREAGASEVNFLAGEVGKIQQFANDFVGKTQKFHKGLYGSFREAFPDKGGDRGFDAAGIAGYAEGDEAVDFVPDSFGLEVGEAAEGGPASGLAPEMNSEDVFGVLELLEDGGIVESGERGVLPGTFVFAFGLEFDQFWDGGSEKVTVYAEVAEEIGLPEFHGEDEGGAVEVFKGLFEGAGIPDEVADGVGADGPGAKDAAFLKGFENGQDFAQESVGLSGCFDDKFA